MKREEAFRRIELCVRAGRTSARKMGVSQDIAERTIRGDVYVEELKKGDFRIRVWKERIRNRALLNGFDTTEALHAIQQYERFFNDG